MWYNENLEDIRFGLNNIRLSVSDSPRKYIDNTNLIIDSYIKTKQ